MSNYEVSVIIPIYNAQNTIKRAIDSVINQTIGFSNIELILYDDASTDDTRDILKEYARKYENIVLILSDENSGHPGKGRNEGMKRASADYIMFMDNDDEYCPTICETLYNEIVIEDADIVSCNYLNIDKTSSKIFYNAIKFGGGGISKNNKTIFIDKNIYDFQDVLIWSKIYKKSVIIENQVKFPEDKPWEDVQFIYLLLNYVNKIVYLKDYVGYIRHVQQDSITRTMQYNSKEVINFFSDINVNNKNINLSWTLTGNITFYLVYIFNNLNNKNEVNKMLNYLYNFEKDNDFDDSYLDIIYKIPNNLIMNKQLKLAIIYLKIVRRFYRNNSLKKFYRLAKK